MWLLIISMVSFFKYRRLLHTFVLSSTKQDVHDFNLKKLHTCFETQLMVSVFENFASREVKAWWDRSIYCFRRLAGQPSRSVELRPRLLSLKPTISRRPEWINRSPMKGRSLSPHRSHHWLYNLVGEASVKLKAQSPLTRNPWPLDLC